ncbi:MAG: alpha/beta fold hydrolase [Desulfomonilia bacterium]
MKGCARILAFAVVLCLVGGCASFQEGAFRLVISAERALSGLEKGSVEINGQRVVYLSREGHGETIVLLHGFGADKDNWVRLVRYLPEEYRVYAFDLPGHGETGFQAEQTYDLEFITGGFSKAVDELGLEKFHLAGNSMGGWISMYYTSENPDRVLTLCLIDPAGVNSPVQSDLQKSLEQGHHVLVPTTGEEFETTLEFVFHRKPFMPWPIRPVVARKMIQRAEISRKIWNDYKGGAREATYLLPTLEIPVYLIWGDRDRITHVSAAEVYAAHIPHLEVVIMKDCGHVPMLERPKETARHYGEFLGDQSEKTVR